MKVNDEVKWVQPVDANEAGERFIVIEVNGDRCLIEDICDLPIRPTTVARTADLTSTR